MNRLGVSNHSCVYRRLPVSEDCVAICYIIILTGEDVGGLGGQIHSYVTPSPVAIPLQYR